MRSKRDRINISDVANTLFFYGTRAMTTTADVDLFTSGFSFLDSSTIQSAGTILTINGPLTGTGVVEIGTNSTLELNGSVASGETIAFTSDSASLILGDPIEFMGTITGLSSSNNFDLSEVTYDTSGDASLVQGNTLDIIENGITITLQIDPTESFTNEYFHLSSDGFQGTNIIESSTPCFLKSTLILSPTGPVKIEDLKIGDSILNEKGISRPVKWIGRRTYHTSKSQDIDIIPIVIKASALADNIPDQDLYLSPRHGIKIDGYIVPVSSIINDASILSKLDIQTIEYFHIELQTHDIILANNTPCETFIDDDSRKMFDNFDEYYNLYPHSGELEYILAAPKLESGAIIERIRRKIALRSGILADYSRSLDVIGYLDFADRQTITGWAYDLKKPYQPVKIDIFNCGALIARTIANSPRPDVCRAGFGHGRCGFSVTLPGPLPSLLRHEISVCPSGSNNFLSGSPVIIDSGIVHDLLKCGLLNTVINAAAKGANSSEELSQLGDQIVILGKRLQSKAKIRSRKKIALQLFKKNLSVFILDEAWPSITLDAGANAIVSHIIAFQEMGATVSFCSTSGEPKTELNYQAISNLKKMGVECYGQDSTPTETIIRSLEEKGINIVYLHRLSSAAGYGGLIRQCLKHAKIIYSVGDLHHLRLARQAYVTAQPDIISRARSVEATEFWAMQLADTVITHSTYEAKYLNKKAPKLNVHIVPWAVKTIGKNRKQSSCTIAFIGSAEHAPNIDAVNNLAGQIMPLVWQHLPNLSCYIVGSGWSKKMFSKFDPKIINCGYVPDLRKFLKNIKLTVAPLRFGAGIKGKVIESMAAGIPCIMTEIAAEGLPLDSDLLQAVSNDQDFAEKMVKIYSDKDRYRLISDAGIKLTKEHFSINSVKTSLSYALGLQDQTIVNSS